MLVLALCACAPKRDIRPAAPPAPRVDIESLLRRGCLHCFEQALSAAQAAGDAQHAFEAAALIVLRAKELGLPLDARLDTLRALVPPGPGWMDLLELVSAIPADRLSGDEYVQQLPAQLAARRRARALVDGWAQAPEPLPASPLFRAYVGVAVACSIQAPSGETGGDVAKRARAAWPDVPLIRYVAASCTGDRATLAAVHEADADFVDVEYALGRIASEGRVPDYDESLRHLRAARDAFPDSIAIATALGNLRIQREEWTDALAAFDAVVAQAPLHRDALLGRVVALTRLARHEEAIAAATHMIELGEWQLGPAYYWRAFNELQLRRLGEAAADRDHAKSLMSNAAVFLLSGLIEWGEHRLPQSEAEFQQALVLDFGQCDAALYMGAVRNEMMKRPEAVAAFKQAIQCYDLAITLRNKNIADIRAGSGSDAAKARLIGMQQRALDEATSQRDEAARDIATIQSSL